MPIDPGTLGGYDIVLAISQEAVNRQLEALYLTEVDPPILNGPKYLIDHEMHFHQKFESGAFARWGIDGYVCCPKVDFGGGTIDDTDDVYRVARITFKFRKAEKDELSRKDREEGKLEDSVYRFLVIDGVDEETGMPKSRLEERIINGMEISWEAVVARKEIANVMNQIVNPSANKKSAVAISKELSDELTKFKSADVFRVSTIFCAFESGRIARSFTILDADGKLLGAESSVPKLNTSAGQSNGNDSKKLDWKTMFQSFVNNIGTSFTNPQYSSVKDGEGIPTPDNPFILGYTISQIGPSMEEYNPAAAEAQQPTPPFFVPKTYRCTLSPRNKYSIGTMNFCILTHRGKAPPNFVQQDPGRQIDDGTDSAGRFKDNLFSSFETKAVPGSSDGILAFSQDIFLNHWIAGTIAPQFRINPSDLAKLVTKFLNQKYSTTFGEGNYNQGDSINAFPATPTEVRSVCRGKEYKWTTKTNSGRLWTKFNLSDDPMEGMKLEVNSEVIVKYKDKFAQDSGISDENDKRRLEIDIESYTWMKIAATRRLATSTLFRTDANDDDHWERSYEMEMWLNFKNKFALGTSNTNRGSFTILDHVAEHLDESNKLKNHEGRPSDPHAPGLWKLKDTFGWTNLWSFTFGDELGKLDFVGQGVGVEGGTFMENSMTKLIDSLKSTIVLPAGDVFMFKGLDSNEAGNVTTIVNYDVSTESEIKKQVAKDWAFEKWRSPTKPA